MDEDKIYYIEDIKKVLPHTYPFLLLDRITHLDLKKTVSGFKNLSVNEPFFQGHFPSFPVMPGALIVESLAQAGAFAILSEEETKGKIVFLAGADDFKFRGMVTPGDRLDLKVDIIDRRANFGIASAEAKVGEKVVASGILKFFIGEGKRKK